QRTVYQITYNLVRPRVIPEVTMTPAHRDFGDDDTEFAFVWGGHESVYTAIRLTVNEIVEITAFAFLAALIQDSSPPEWIGQQISELALGGLPKLSFLNIKTDNDVGFQRLLITFFHVRHETIRRLQRGIVDEIVVVPQSCGSGQKQA